MYTGANILQVCFEVLSQYLDRETLDKTDKLDKLDKTDPKQTNIRHYKHLT